MSLSAAQWVGTGIDVWQKLQVAVGWKPDSLQVAQDSERGLFTRLMLTLGNDRVYRMRAYIDAMLADASAVEQRARWEEYLKSAAEWDSQVVINQLVTAKWYGSKKSHEFADINAAFAQSHACMNDVHFYGIRETSSAGGFCQPTDKALMVVFDRNIVFTRMLANGLLGRMACFATGLPAEPTKWRDVAPVP